MTMLGGSGRKTFSVDTTTQFLTNGRGEHGETLRQANPYYNLDKQTVRPTATSTHDISGVHTDDSLGNAWDAIQEQKNFKPWTPPTLVDGNKFQSQADVDAFKSALAPKSYGNQPDNQSGYTASYNGNPMYTAGGEQNYNAAAKWGTDTGILPARQNESGLPGLHSFNDFMSTWAPIIAIAAPAIAGVAGAAGAAGAEGSAALTADQLLAQSAAGLSPASLGDTAATLGVGEVTALGGAASDSLLAETPTPPADTGVPGFNAGGPGGAGSGGNFDLGGGQPGGDLIGNTKALDPIAAPASEAAPVPGFDGGPAATTPTPSPTNWGDILGKVGSWAKDGLLVGSLIGGLAGLGGKSNVAGEAPPPPPGAPPEPTPVQSQESVKADLSTQMQPGAPLAGNSSTWLTGAGGIPDDQLQLGKQTLLGK